MKAYAPKQDTTRITQSPSDGGGSSSRGLSTGALVGMIYGVLVVLGIVLDVIFYKRRQKQIQIQEAGMDKEAYLASLRPENGDSKTGAVSPMPARVLQSIHSSSPGLHHQGFITMG